MTEKCWNCGKHPISVKDYRADEQDNINKTFVCKYCFNLNDKWYDRVARDKLDPKKVLQEAV